LGATQGGDKEKKRRGENMSREEGRTDLLQVTQVTKTIKENQLATEAKISSRKRAEKKKFGKT